MQGVCGCGRRTDFVKVEGNIGTEETGGGGGVSSGRLFVLVWS